MDRTHLERWQHNGDAEALTELVNTYAGMVYGICLRVLRNRADAQDAAQQCFLKLVERRPAPRDEFGAWLHVVALHEAVKHLRGNQRRLAREERYADQQASSTESSWDELSGHVDEAIAALPSELREVVVAHFLRGESQTAIAARIGMSRQTVTHRVSQGVNAIREQLRKKGLIVSSAALFTSLEGEAMVPAPPTLIAELGKAALAGPTAVSGVAHTFAHLFPGKVVAACVVTLGIVAALAASQQFVAQPAAPVVSSHSESLQAPADTPPAEVHANVAALSTTPDNAAAPVQRAVNHVTSKPTDDAHGTISGVVLLPDGTGFANAKVTCQRIGEIRGDTTIAAGADGTFAFEGVAPGDYSVQANSPKSGIIGRPYELARVLLAANESVTDLVLRYGTEGNLSISGTVFDEYGNPLPDASVQCLDSLRRETTSRSDGTFTLPYLPEGIWNVQALKYGEGPLSRSAEPVTVPAGSSNVELRMLGHGRIEGRVVDATTGLPFAKFEVGYMGNRHPTFDQSVIANMRSFSNSDGRFTLYEVYRGDVAVVARAPGFAPSIQRVVVVPSETVKDVEIRLDRGGSVSGLVVDENGEPIPNAEVAVGKIAHVTELFRLNDKRKTRHDGTFTMEALPADATILSVYHPDYAPNSGVIVPDMVVTLERAATIVAEVYSAGEPVYMAKVRAIPAANVRLDYMPGGMTEQNGVATITGLVPGPTLVQLVPNEGRMLEKVVTIQPSETQSIRFDLPPATCSLSGTLTVQGESSTMGIVTLHLVVDGVNERHETPVVDGTFKLINLPSGTGTIIAEAMGDGWYRKTSREQIAVNEDSTQPIDIDLAGELRITGAVPDSYGPDTIITMLSGSFTFQQACDALANFNSANSIFTHTFVNADRSYEFNHLEPGTYTLLLMRRSIKDWETREFLDSRTINVSEDSTCDF